MRACVLVLEHVFDSLCLSPVGFSVSPWTVALEDVYFIDSSN